MRIYVYVESFPNTFKPYYDVQLADLVRAGHDVRVFAGSALHGDFSAEMRELGFPARTSYYAPDEFRGLPRFVPAIAAAVLRNPLKRVAIARRAIERHRTFSGRVVGAGRMMGLPLDPPDLCFVHGTGPMALLKSLRELYPGVPVALYYHGGKPEEAVPQDSRIADIFREADIVFTNTNASRMEAIGRGAVADCVHVLPVGLDLALYVPSTPRSYRIGGVLRLLSVGRLTNGKGLEFAIRAIAKVAAARDGRVDYTIVGRGPIRKDLQLLIEELQLGGKIHLVGALPNHDVRELMGRTDILLLPSIATKTWAETQAVVVQEALLMGSMVVVASTGGVPESIPPEFKSYMVPPSDADAIANAILAIDRCSDAELAKFGSDGRAWVAGHYDITVTNGRLLNEVESMRRSHAADAPLTGAR